MKISYAWLREYIDIPESPEELGQVLTSTGLEVESIESFETVKGGLKGLVIGEVLTCSKHPNADKLSLTTVDVGGEKILNIVCGAPNVKAGQKVVVALVGSTLYPSKGEPFTIKAAKIRGEQSEGMICAEDETGLGEGHEGIMVLDTNAVNGTPAAAYFNVQSDHVFEIGLTPNRADAASHIGVARDIKAAKKRSLAWPSIEGFNTTGEDSNPISITVEDRKGCIRYSGLTINGVTVGESPVWLQNRLRSIGLTPINNVVDVTNFVLHEVGQPLHAFDAGKIAGKKVIVKTLPAGTKFTTLDGKERSLLVTDLMICSEREAMCIAGVFGGVDSGITGQTQQVFLESACFAPDYIRKTAMHHQLKTDASFRFERGTDPEITVYALKRAALLIKEIAGGTISAITDIYPEEIPGKEILVKDKNVNRLIGKTIPRSEIFDILERLDIRITDKGDDAFTVVVPPYRVDVEQEADIVEEILRIYGFNNIELSDRTGTEFFAEFPVREHEKYKRAISEMLVSNGFFEIWTNSLTSKSFYEQHPVPLKGEPVEMLNKLSEEQGIMRLSMLFTGLEVCVYNINRKQKDLKMFEHGKIYWKETREMKDSAKSSKNIYHEQEKLALYMTGNEETENWQHKTQPVSYYDLTQHVYEILRKSGFRSIRKSPLAEAPFEYGLTFSDENGNEIGKAGKVRASILKSLGIRQELFYAELNSSLLFKAANPKLVIQEVSKFPEVRRDLSVVLDRQVSFDEIKELIHSIERRLIKDIIVFDVYEGENIPRSKKAYAMGFTLQDESKTLTDEEIDKTMNRLITAFEQKLGAVIRK